MCLYITMEDNLQYELALKCINRTDLSLFLTGKAGTGKTTFLKNLQDTCEKKFVVVAPTGIAAINAGGVTINSFFQLPPEPYLPDFPEFMTAYDTKDHRKMQRFKWGLMKALELLVIDEISMVRADMMDAISDTLKKARHSDEPFGGVQLLMIGDIYQLPPVVTERESKYINTVYKSPFFFSSRAFKDLFIKNKVVSIELQKVYRQENLDFVKVLNKFRDNTVDIDAIRTINSRIDQPDPGAITLCTHNYQATEINDTQMSALEGKLRIFDAKVEGNFPVNLFPIDAQLMMKVGERVMFIKNNKGDADTSYYNGMLGTIEEFIDVADSTAIRVRTDEGKTIEVNRACWTNVKYRHAEDTDDIEQVVEGMFEQYPLKPAWAVTIHKAQGLTFDKVNIDAAKAFAFGQVYVALSRCRSLEGLHLLSPVKFSSVFTNKYINNFVKTLKPFDKVAEEICYQAGDEVAVIAENVMKAREVTWVH